MNAARNLYESPPGRYVRDYQQVGGNQYTSAGQQTQTYPEQGAWEQDLHDDGMNGYYDPEYNAQEEMEKAKNAEWWNLFWPRFYVIVILLISATVSGVFAYSAYQCGGTPSDTVSDEEVRKLKFGMILNVGVIGLCIGYITALIGSSFEMISALSKFLLAILVGGLALSSLISYFKIRKQLELVKKMSYEIHETLTTFEIIAGFGFGIAIGMMLNLFMIFLETRGFVTDRNNVAVVMSMLIGISISVFHIYEADCEGGLVDGTRWAAMGIIGLIVAVAITLLYFKWVAYDKSLIDKEQSQNDTTRSY
jgi:heme/copper-type cytochrome/quinol oxidase subunit 2